MTTTSTPPARPPQRAVRTSQRAWIIEGVHTECLVTDYDDRALVVVTQVAKLGLVFHAAGGSVERGGGDGGNLPGHYAPKLRALSGGGRKDDELVQAVASRVVQVVRGAGVDKPVIVSMGLEKAFREMDALRGMARVCGDFAAEALSGVVHPSSAAVSAAT